MPGKSPDGEPTRGKGPGVLKVSNQKEAEAEALKMEEAFKRAKTAQERARIKRVAIFASNMASSMSKQKNVSAATRERYSAISWIYRKLFNTLKGIENSCK